MSDRGDNQAKETGSEPPVELMRVEVQARKAAPEKSAEKPEAKPPTLRSEGETANKIREILRDDNNLELFAHALATNYANMSREEQEKVKMDIAGIVEEELNSGEFTPRARAVYTVYVLSKNEQITEAAQQLVDRKQNLPAGCPIEVPKHKTTGAFYDMALYRQEIANGKLHAQLPTYYEDNEKLPRSDEKRVPSLDQIIQLNKAEKWLEEAEKEILNPANIHNAVKLVQERLNLIFDGKPPSGWLPPKDLDDKQAQAYLDKVLPWIKLVNQARDSTFTVLNLNRLSKEGGVLPHAFLGSSNFAETLKLKEIFPGRITWDDYRTTLDFDLPKDLVSTSASRGQRQRMEEYLLKVNGSMAQALDEYVSSLDSSRVLYWGDLPFEGIHEGKEFNKIKSRYEANLVNVNVNLPNGKTETQQRIKVTTSVQRQYEPFISYSPLGWRIYDIGKPDVSGHASVNGETLPDNEQAIGLDSKGQLTAASFNIDPEKATPDNVPYADVRLNKDGIIQVRATANLNSELKLTDSTGQSHKLIRGTTATDFKPGPWVDCLPGYTLTIGEHKIDLNNDVRFYKPDQVVALRQYGASANLVMAKDLPTQARLAYQSELLGKAVPAIIDFGFAIGGALEFKVGLTAFLQSGKILAERGIAEIAAAKLANAEARQAAISALRLTQKDLARSVVAVKDADRVIPLVKQIISTDAKREAALVERQQAISAIKSSGKHLFLGSTAAIQNPTVKEARGLVMGGDIFLGSVAEHPE